MSLAIVPPLPAGEHKQVTVDADCLPGIVGMLRSIEQSVTMLRAVVEEIYGEVL